MPEAPLAGDPKHIDDRGRWMYTTFIDLVVDGEIVDLNRTPLPAYTPIFDKRFEDEAEKAEKRSGPTTREERGSPPATAR